MANFTLGTGADTIVGGAEDDTVIGIGFIPGLPTAHTLNPGDSLTGGAGIDTLALYGYHGFHVDELATFTGFEVIRLTSPGVRVGDETVLYLGSQSVAVIGDGPGALSVYLGSGAVTVGGPINVYSRSASDWNAGNSIDGGSITLNAPSSNFPNGSDNAFYDLTTNTLSNINSLIGYGANLTVQINSAAASGVSNFKGNGPNDQLVTSDAALDLSHSTVDGFTVASSNTTGTNFIVHDIATAYQVTGGSGNDTLTAEGFTFSAAQRNVIFAAASIEYIVDSSGTYTSSGLYTIDIAPTITSNGGGDTAAVSIVENTTAVTTVTAADPDAGQSLSYSIVGGSDGGLFAIDTTTGALAFVTAPNFEAPTDTGPNNVYDVTVEVSDGNGGTDTQAIAVSITNVVGISPPASDAAIQTGTGEEDTLTGLGGNNTLQGLGGDDFLVGGAGNDVLDGGDGTDTMAGGSGNDTYVVDDAGDVVTEADGEGTDLVQSSISYVLSNGVENLTLVSGAGNINGTGNALNNILVGNESANQLDGGLGTDSVSYAYSTHAVVANLFAGQAVDGAVTDTLLNFENFTGSPLNDLVVGNALANVLDGGAGTDMVSYYYASQSVTVNLHTGQATSGGVTDTLLNFENVYGSKFSDLIAGSNGANFLDGAGGSDMVSYYAASQSVTVNLYSGVALSGGVTDTLANFENVYGSNFGDLIAGSNGANFLDGAGGSDMVSYYAASQGVTVNLATGIANDGAFTDMLLNFENVFGSSFGDTIIGNGSNNYFDGAGGADTLTGGAGNDTFTFTLGQANGDTITDFNGNGAAAGDQLQFMGYGTVAQGATLTQIDATHWQIHSGLDDHIDIITLQNSASVNATDFIFL